MQGTGSSHAATFNTMSGPLRVTRSADAKFEMDFPANPPLTCASNSTVDELVQLVCSGFSKPLSEGFMTVTCSRSSASCRFTQFCSAHQRTNSSFVLMTPQARMNYGYCYQLVFVTCWSVTHGFRTGCGSRYTCTAEGGPDAFGRQPCHWYQRYRARCVGGSRVEAGELKGGLVVRLGGPSGSVLLRSLFC